MDVFCDRREMMRRYERYVVDLRRLFLFHGLPCGAAEHFSDLAAKLEESRALRMDLPAMLRNIRDLEQQSISADEMLTVVALASGGEELVEGRAGSAGMMRTVGLLQMMLAGVGTWAETNGAERVGPVRDEAATGAGGERAFVELAIEELRLQLGEVKRQLRELETQPVEPGAVAGTRADAAGLADAAGVAGAESLAGDGVAIGAEADRGRAAVFEAAERAAALEVEERAALERERVAAEELAAQMERERARAWPLEERVSPLPVMPKRSRVTGRPAVALPEESAEKQRGRSVRLAAMATGLLLAVVGLYGTMRSGSARAGSAGVGTVAGGAPAAGVGVPAAGGISVGAAAADVGGGASRDGGGGRVVAEGRQVGEGSRVAGAEAGSGRGSAMPAPVKAPARTVVAASAAKPVAAAKGASGAGVEAKGVSGSGTAAADRRDDAAMAELKGRPRQGKFLFVPAAVMETHLVSSRKPVVPATVAAGPARVVLNAFIGKDGTVSRTDVVEGPPGLIDSAVAAVSWRRYRPFLVRGEPAEVVTPVVVTYGGTGR